MSGMINKKKKLHTHVLLTGDLIQYNSSQILTEFFKDQSPEYLFKLTYLHQYY